MVSVEIKDQMVLELIKELPKQAGRAAEQALDRTAKDIKLALQEEMRRVFAGPVPYTINSLLVTPTHKHNMQATVWFKEPARMGQHYLVPQVEGGSRKLKGFERGVGLGELIPAMGAQMNKSGNISTGQIKQIMSVLGKTENWAGVSSNITTRSRKRNTKERDFVVIPNRHGRLLPGVYKRFQTRVGFGAKTKNNFTDRSKSYQRGRTRGRFASVIRARGLRPVLLVGRTGHAVKPLLDFYGVAERTFDQRFIAHFWSLFRL